MKRKIGQRSPEDLKPHALQNQVVFDVDDAAFQRLRNDIAKNGIQQRIEITKNGRVIDGHQRLRAALELGLEWVPVWVREDLRDDAEV